MTDTAPSTTPKRRQRAPQERRHELRHKPPSNLATCRCGDWSLSDETKQPLSPKTVKTNYNLHKEMIDHAAVTTTSRESLPLRSPRN
jgi:hypothetical protein